MHGPEIRVCSLLAFATNWPHQSGYFAALSCRGALRRLQNDCEEQERTVARRVSNRFGVGQPVYAAAGTLCPAALGAPMAVSGLSTGRRMKSVSHVEKTQRLIPAAETPADARSKGPAISKQRKPPCASTSGGTAPPMLPYARRAWRLLRRTACSFPT